MDYEPEGRRKSLRRDSEDSEKRQSAPIRGSSDDDVHDSADGAKNGFMLVVR